MEKLAGESEGKSTRNCSEMKARIKPTRSCTVRRRATDAQIRLIARYFATGGKTSTTTVSTSTSSTTTTGTSSRSRSRNDN